MSIFMIRFHIRFPGILLWVVGSRGRLCDMRQVCVCTTSPARLWPVILVQRCRGALRGGPAPDKRPVPAPQLTVPDLLLPLQHQLCRCQRRHHVPLILHVLMLQVPGRLCVSCEDCRGPIHPEDNDIDVTTWLCDCCGRKSWIWAREEDIEVLGELLDKTNLGIRGTIRWGVLQSSSTWTNLVWFETVLLYYDKTVSKYMSI